METKKVTTLATWGEKWKEKFTFNESTNMYSFIIDDVSTEFVLPRRPSGIKYTYSPQKKNLWIAVEDCRGIETE